MAQICSARNARCGGDWLGACGSYNGERRPVLHRTISRRSTRRRTTQEGRKLTVLAAADVDFIDPGAGYYNFTYMVDFATQRTLRGMAFRRDG